MAFGDTAVQLDFTLNTGSTKILQYRVVRLTSSNTVVHTTGVSTAATGPRPFGIAQEQISNIFPSTGKGYIAVRAFGVSKVQASTKAIKVGSYLTITSGAVSSTNFLGGTVKATTSNAQGSFIIGVALTSQAATATPGLIAAMISPIGRG